MDGWHSARTIVGRLGGRWHGRSGSCPCPAHEDRTPSLSVSETRDGRVLVHCFAGCSQSAVIDALRRAGLWGGGEPTVDPSYPAHLTSPADGMLHRDERSRRQVAQRIWDQARPAASTLAEHYLRARGIHIPMPDQLRFHTGLRHPTARPTFPAMVARIADEKGFCAVQRTFLAADGKAKAPVDDAKLGLGPMGAGAVRLFPIGDILGLAEGIETALSACQLYSLPVWATLSAARLARIQIPSQVRQLTIFADAGEVGRREAFAAGDAYEHRGFSVEIITPAAHHEDGGADDFNDIVQAHRDGRLPDRQGSV
jgi:hypothetical protein